MEAETCYKAWQVWAAFGVGIFIGTFVGWLTMGLCYIARGNRAYGPS